MTTMLKTLKSVGALENGNGIVGNDKVKGEYKEGGKKLIELALGNGLKGNKKSVDWNKDRLAKYKHDRNHKRFFFSVLIQKKNSQKNKKKLEKENKEWCTFWIFLYIF